MCDADLIAQEGPRTSPSIIASVGGNRHWARGAEHLGWLDESPERDYTVLIGATTYRLMSGFATSGEDGSSELTEASKVVFSSSLKAPLEWANTRLIDEDPVEAVRSLKAESIPGLRTIGSLTLCRSLLAAGLVDRFRVVVFSVITGSTGRERIYDGFPDVALEMVASQFRRQAAAARVRAHGSHRSTETRHDLNRTRLGTTERNAANTDVGFCHDGAVAGGLLERYRGGEHVEAIGRWTGPRG